MNFRDLQVNQIYNNKDTYIFVLQVNKDNALVMAFTITDGEFVYKYCFDKFITVLSDKSMWINKLELADNYSIFIKAVFDESSNLKLFL
jgi:hypothetical protein